MGALPCATGGRSPNASVRIGPEFSEPPSARGSGQPDGPNLHELLGAFLEALCLIDVISRTLTTLSEDASERVGSCAVALKHGYQLLDAAYSRFDEALAASAPADVLSDFDPETVRGQPVARLAISDSMRPSACRTCLARRPSATFEFRE